MHLFSHPFLQTSQIILNFRVASGWASNLAQEARLGYGVVGDPPTRVTAWGRFSPQHQNGRHQARRGPGTRMRSVAEGILPTFRPLGREGREPREGNSVHRLESSRPGPRRRIAVPRARREGGNLHKMAERHPWTGGSATAGRLPPDPPASFRTFGTGNGSQARARARVGGAALPEVPLVLAGRTAPRPPRFGSVARWRDGTRKSASQSGFSAAPGGRDPVRAAIPPWVGRERCRGTRALAPPR